VSSRRHGTTRSIRAGRRPVAGAHRIRHARLRTSHEFLKVEDELWPCSFRLIMLTRDALASNHAEPVLPISLKPTRTASKCALPFLPDNPSDDLGLSLCHAHGAPWLGAGSPAASRLQRAPVRIDLSHRSFDQGAVNRIPRRAASRPARLPAVRANCQGTCGASVSWPRTLPAIRTRARNRPTPTRSIIKAVTRRFRQSFR